MDKEGTLLPGRLLLALECKGSWALVSHRVHSNLFSRGQKSDNFQLFIILKLLLRFRQTTPRSIYESVHNSRIIHPPGLHEEEADLRKQIRNTH